MVRIHRNEVRHDGKNILVLWGQSKGTTGRNERTVRKPRYWQAGGRCGERRDEAGSRRGRRQGRGWGEGLVAPPRDEPLAGAGVYSQVRRAIGPLDGVRRLAPTACDSGRSVNISDSLPPTDLFSGSTTCTCGPVHATYARGWEYSRIYAVHPEPHLCESSLHK